MACGECMLKIILDFRDPFLMTSLVSPCLSMCGLYIPTLHIQDTRSGMCEDQHLKEDLDRPRQLLRLTTDACQNGCCFCLPFVIFPRRDQKMCCHSFDWMKSGFLRKSAFYLHMRSNKH